MKLGEIIHDFRITNKMTMQDFASKANLSKGYISMIEKNQHPQSQRTLVPSFETYEKVASAMGISIDELVSCLDGNETVKLHASSSEKSSSEKEPDPVTELITLSGFSNEERLILAFFDELNDEGKALMLDYAELLYSSDKYKKRTCSDVEKKTAV